MSVWEWYRRLEPILPIADLGRGFAAEIADPVWFLGRQWQLGEHQGEDASSPVLIELDVTHHQMEGLGGSESPDLDPTLVPAEALIEAEPDSWWTMGRRIRLGRAAAAVLGEGALANDVRFEALPVPYQDFVGKVDGLRVFRQGLLPAAHPVWAEVPATARPDTWRDDTLTYDAEFPAGSTELRIRDHDGGDVDWYTADGNQPLMPEEADSRKQVAVVPSRLQYPGAPQPRWWQIEDGHVDIGGFPPDRSHFATMLLLEASVAHTDDWFTFPVPSPLDAPSVGTVVTLVSTVVKDSFDDRWTLRVPPGRGDAAEPGFSRPWSLFRTTGLDRTSLVIWPTALTPLTGPVLDDIILGVDEDANLLWAVELRADGVALAPDAESLAARIETTPTGTRRFRYLPSSSLPPHWHAYRIEPRGVPPKRRFVQGLVADLNGAAPVLRRGPRSSLLGGNLNDPLGDGHELAPSAAPNAGLRLERRWVLARRTDGTCELWIQRRRIPHLAGPESSLRFDVLTEAARNNP